MIWGAGQPPHPHPACLLIPPFQRRGRLPPHRLQVLSLNQRLYNKLSKVSINSWTNKVLCTMQSKSCERTILRPMR